MNQLDDNLVELVRTAISLELNGEYFYRRAADATLHPQGKRMFLHLAKEEGGHIEEIRSLFGDLLGEEDWQQILAEETANPRMSPVIAQLETAVASRAHSDVADDTQALRLAMELERRAIQFFERLTEITDDPLRLKLIRQMVEEEHFHYDFLQAELDSVLNVGIWLDAPEFRQDGKF